MNLLIKLLSWVKSLFKKRVKYPIIHTKNVKLVEREIKGGPVLMTRQQRRINKRRYSDQRCKYTKAPTIHV